MFNLLSALEMDCFASDYDSARQKFLTGYQNVAPELVRSFQSFLHPLPGPRNEALYCDVLQLGLSDTPERVLVLISATHGVEGFAGSAIQCDCLPVLESVLQENADLGVMIIHALNPWGFAWLRRYDHEGIDINRNFVDFAHNLPDNPGYEQLHSRLLSASDFEKGKSAWIPEGMEFDVFSDTIIRGQYHHPDGLFFGGKGPSWSRTTLEQVTSTPIFESAIRIAVIDLHTGLGPYGYGEIINDHPVNSAGYELVVKWYRDNSQSTVLGDSVSGIKQGLIDYHWFDVMGDRGCFVTLEFGTYSLDRLLTYSINELIYHNRLQQSGEARNIDNPAVQQLKEFFYPQEASWQQQVLFRGRQVISMALEGVLQ